MLLIDDREAHLEEELVGPPFEILATAKPCPTSAPLTEVLLLTQDEAATCNEWHTLTPLGGLATDWSAVQLDVRRGGILNQQSANMEIGLRKTQTEAHFTACCAVLMEAAPAHQLLRGSSGQSGSSGTSQWNLLDFELHVSCTFAAG